VRICVWDGDCGAHTEVAGAAAAVGRVALDGGAFFLHVEWIGDSSRWDELALSEWALMDCVRLSCQGRVVGFNWVLESVVVYAGLEIESPRLWVTVVRCADSYLPLRTAHLL
jgi:hypothetical protein